MTNPQSVTFRYFHTHQPDAKKSRSLSASPRKNEPSPTKDQRAASPRQGQPTAKELPERPAPRSQNLSPRDQSQLQNSQLPVFPSLLPPVQSFPPSQLEPEYKINKFTSVTVPPPPTLPVRASSHAPKKAFHQPPVTPHHLQPAFHPPHNEMDFRLYQQRNTSQLRASVTRAVEAMEEEPEYSVPTAWQRPRPHYEHIPYNVQSTPDTAGRVSLPSISSLSLSLSHLRRAPDSESSYNRILPTPLGLRNADSAAHFPPSLRFGLQ